MFILRAIIDISVADRKPTFITFYDVSKAYDNVNNKDLLVTMWSKGLKGKAWRILKSLNENLSAMINTRFGKTREVQMEIGDKQGSRLTGRMFAKMMDLLAEELKETGLGFEVMKDFLIPALLWVDDVITCTEGIQNQHDTLDRVNEFAIKHRIKWGQDKCNVLRVARHKDEKNEWKVGEMPIKETTQYKYLGDIICSNGKNAENIKSRKSKIQTSTVSINTIAGSEILNKIETSVLLELHESMNISSLLFNCESWNLSKGEEDELEKIELQALKNLFDLPLHTPSASIIHSFGILFTRQRVEHKMLIYLHRILQRNETHWVRKTFDSLRVKNLGWYKKIVSILMKYKLPTDFSSIKAHSPGSWKTIVTLVIDEENHERLITECFKSENGEKRPKSKTSCIAERIAEKSYTRKPEDELMLMTKHETKTILIARYGMLECGKNYKGTMKQQCEKCKCEDDENHGMNHCIKWRERNFHHYEEKVNFNLIYSKDLHSLRYIISKIEEIWNTRNAHGTMRTE